jgi:hypothetical protein
MPTQESRPCGSVWSRRTGRLSGWVAATTLACLAVSAVVAQSPNPPRGGAKGQAPADPKAEDQGDDAAPAAEEQPADLPVAPDKNCGTCYGIGFIPHSPHRPYVHIEGQPAPNPAAAVPWRHCNKCQKERKPQELIDAETQRLKEAMSGHLRWENRTGWPMLRMETRHVTIHGQLPPEVAVRQGQAANELVAYLQRRTRGVVLTQTRPDTHEILFCWDEPQWMRMIQICQGLPEFRQDWALVSQTAGYSNAQSSVVRAREGKGVPPEHHTVSDLARASMYHSTDYQARTWLSIGFAYYCERAILKKNLLHYIEYEPNAQRLGENWNQEVKKYAQQRKLRLWNDLLELPLRDYDPPDHLGIYMMVAYLFEADPIRFTRMVQMIGRGIDDKAAMEAAYEKTIDELQTGCAKWIANF